MTDKSEEGPNLEGLNDTTLRKMWKVLPKGRWRVVKIYKPCIEMGDTAIFHRWGFGLDWDSGLDESATCAVCEFPSGEVRLIYADRITFTGETIRAN